MKKPLFFLITLLGLGLSSLAQAQNLVPYTYTGMLDLSLGPVAKLGVLTTMEEESSGIPDAMAFVLNWEHFDKVFTVCRIGDICTVTGIASFNSLAMFFEIEEATLTETMRDFANRRGLSEETIHKMEASAAGDMEYLKAWREED